MLLVIVKLLSERRDRNELKEQVQALSKKHGQLRESTKKMVGAVMEVWEAGKAEEDEREGLTVCLRDVTEGKQWKGEQVGPGKAESGLQNERVILTPEQKKELSLLRFISVIHLSASGGHRRVVALNKFRDGRELGQ
ncbi:hypothetical protein BT69DRAFT_1347615 [Atractiella rhizophila]|nr:hypothetical protein BT69DRAFT_1347615 [Atractiella rhizophila]